MFSLLQNHNFQEEDLQLKTLYKNHGARLHSLNNQVLCGMKCFLYKEYYHLRQRLSGP